LLLLPIGFYSYMPGGGAKFPHDAPHASQPHAPQPSGPEPHAAEQSQPAEPTGPEALAEALRHVAEAREYFVHLLTAEIERFKLRLRKVAVWAVVGLIAIVLLLALLAAAVGLLLFGLAELVGSLLGGYVWLGAVVVGGGMLLIGILAAAWGLWAWQASANDAVRQRFAARKRRQQDRFGKSVDSADQ
jgi:hypothetical protein